MPVGGRYTDYRVYERPTACNSLQKYSLEVMVQVGIYGLVDNGMLH